MEATVKTMSTPAPNMISSSLVKREVKELRSHSVFKILLTDEHVT